MVLQPPAPGAVAFLAGEPAGARRGRAVDVVEPVGGAVEPQREAAGPDGAIGARSRAMR